MTIQYQKIFSSNSPQIDCVEYQKSQAKHAQHKGTQRNQLMHVSERVWFCKATKVSRFVSFVPVPFPTLCNDQKDELIHIRIQSRSDANFVAYVNFRELTTKREVLVTKRYCSCVCAAYFSSIYSKRSVIDELEVILGIESIAFWL
jgi:hypothetical protein